MQLSQVECSQSLRLKSGSNVDWPIFERLIDLCCHDRINKWLYNVLECEQTHIHSVVVVVFDVETERPHMHICQHAFKNAELEVWIQIPSQVRHLVRCVIRAILHTQELSCEIGIQVCIIIFAIFLQLDLWRYQSFRTFSRAKPNVYCAWHAIIEPFHASNNLFQICGCELIASWQLDHTKILYRPEKCVQKVLSDLHLNLVVHRQVCCR